MERGARLGARRVELGAALEHGDAVGCQHRAEKRHERRAVRRAEERRDVALGHAAAGARGRLIEKRKAVAEAARGRRGERRQRRAFDRGLFPFRLGSRVHDLEAFALGDVREAAGHLVVGEAAEVEALAAREDRRRDLVALGRREDEDGVRRRFLEGLQKGLERGRGDRVDFVDDEDLAAVARRRVGHDLDEVARLIHLAVRGAVDLESIERAALEHLDARGALAAGSRRWAIGRVAVDGRREETRRGGLADAARPREEIRVRQPVGGDGVRQRPDDLLLADDVRERARPPLAGEGNIGRSVAHVRTVHRGRVNRAPR